MNPNEKLIIHMFQHFNERNQEALANYFHEEVEHLHPLDKTSFIKKTGWDISKRLAALERKYLQLTEEIQLVSSSGNQVFVHYTSKGTDINGKWFALPAWSIFTIENGKIIREASYISVPEKKAA